jgi:NAD(P)H-hydrate epimerase
MKVCKVAEIRELDRRAIEEYEIPAQILMEDAGAAVFNVIRSEIGIQDKKFVVLCGPGNNGGDGFVVARQLHAAGGQVKVLFFTERSKYKNESGKNLDIIAKFPLERVYVTSKEQIKQAISDSDIIIDALLGTGLDREVQGLIREAIELVNESGNIVVAIDIPSGINGDTGQVMGAAIKADYTITFGLPKVGNLLYPGFGNGGKLYVSHISYPQSLSNSPSLTIEIPLPITLPERQPDKNKMDFGPVLVIAGAANYFWAPHASAYSFLKTGGGYVYLACPKSLISAVARKGREVVFQPMEETISGSIALSNKDKLLQLSERMRMVIIGPGMSLDDETQQLIRALTNEINKPLLIDGDGITSVTGDINAVLNRKEPTILTPHVGEMGRITGKSREDIENNRIGILKETALKLNAHVVLKGAHSLIGSPEGKVFINLSSTTDGKSGMATAGSGDVLNGTIAAMYCLGLNLEEAVRTGVFIHGMAGDLAASAKGPDGMTARDILNTLPKAVKYYRQNLRDIRKNYYDTIHLI